MESDFELARQGLDEFVLLGHKGLKTNIFYQPCYNQKHITNQPIE